MKYLQYFWYVVRHKWYVFLACRAEGLYWRGLIHDWSKFRPSEFFPYTEHFYGEWPKKNCYKCVSILGNQCSHNGSGIGQGEQAERCKDYLRTGAGVRDKTGYYKPTDTGDPAFDYAWFLHQKRNPHHWQWWVLPDAGDETQVLAMRQRYYKEMLCDWIGASKAQGHGGIVSAWYLANAEQMAFHPDTWEALEAAMRLKAVLEGGD